MKKFTRTMYERNYEVTVYVASEDCVKTMEVCRHETENEPEGVGDTIFYQEEECKVLKGCPVSCKPVKVSVPINVFVNVAQTHGTIKCIE